MTISIYQYKWNTLTISVIKNVFLWLRRVAGLCGPDGEGPAVTQYPPVKSAICSVQQFLVWPLLTDLSVEIYFPGPGVCIVLLLLLAAREHAADQALGAGHSGGGAGLIFFLVRVLNQRADLGHTYSRTMTKA